jgi:Fe2+ transport system protein B
MFYGVFADPPNFSGLAIGGPNYYQSINIWYFTIEICLVVYMVGMLLGRALPAVLVRILALCVSTFPFINMLMYKFPVRDSSSRKEWLETSIYLDCICLVFVAAIVGIEFIMYTSRKNDGIPLTRVV